MEKNNTHTIDAAGKSLGRIASEAAKALMGKMTVTYAPNVFSDIKVTITNAALINMKEIKRVQKTYIHYTGFPGGLKKESFNMLFARKGAAAPIKKAIERMLPKNTMRAGRMKNLTITP